MLLQPPKTAEQFPVAVLLTPHLIDEQVPPPNMITADEPTLIPDEPDEPDVPLVPEVPDVPLVPLVPDT